MTITTATFSLAVAGAGGAPVDGTVTYDPTSQIATFRPAANLTAGTQYTATISNLVTDLFGNALAAGAASNPWTFTTGSTLGLTLPDLGAASTFGSFGGGAGITNTGTNTVINGDLGTTGGSTLITGFHDAGTGCNYTITGANSGFVNGKIYTNVPPPTGTCPSEGTAVTFAIATQAASDALAAYNNLAGCPQVPIQARVNSADLQSLLGPIRRRAVRSLSPARISLSMPKAMRTPSGSSKWPRRLLWVLQDFLAASF